MIARSFLLFAGIAIGGVVVHYYDRAECQKAQDAINIAHQMAIKQIQEQGSIAMKALQQRLDESDVKALLDQSIIDRYIKEIAKLQDELSSVKSDLEFYEQVLPSSPAGGVSVRSFDIVREGSMFSYKILLSRHAVTGSIFKGRLQFVAKGRLNGKPEIVDLVPAVINAENELALPSDKADIKTVLKDRVTSAILSLQFERWQQVKGNLVLPAGFEPEEIVLNVLEGKYVRASKTVIVQAP